MTQRFMYSFHAEEQGLYCNQDNIRLLTSDFTHLPDKSALIVQVDDGTFQDFTSQSR